MIDEDKVFYVEFGEFVIGEVMGELWVLRINGIVLVF